MVIVARLAHDAAQCTCCHVIIDNINCTFALFCDILIIDSVFQRHLATLDALIDDRFVVAMLATEHTKRKHRSSSLFEFAQNTISSCVCMIDRGESDYRDGATVARYAARCDRRCATWPTAYHRSIVRFVSFLFVVCLMIFFLFKVILHDVDGLLNEFCLNRGLFFV